MIHVGSLVLKTNAGMMCIVTERRGGAPHSVLRAMRVIFKIFIINTIKFRPLFWFFFSFLYLNIQEHSLSNVHHQYYKERDTSRKKQWKMLIKLKELLSIFLYFFKFFLNLSFCSFIFFGIEVRFFWAEK